MPQTTFQRALVKKLHFSEFFLFLGKKFLSCFLGLGLEKKEVRVLKALKSRRSNNQETFF